MKNKKRIILVVFCFLMLFASSAYAKPSKAKVKKAYKKYIANVKSNGIHAFNIHYNDINRDGVLELFCERPEGADSALEVCTYKKGKVKAAGYMTGKVFKYNTKAKRLYAEFSGGGGTITKIYKLSGSKLKMTVKYEAVSWASSYRKNGKSISWEKYEKETKQYNNWKVLGGVNG